MTGYHEPVMIGEVLQLMRVRVGGTYVDMTLGGGGYAEKLLESLGPDGLVLGIDQDAEAIAFATERLKKYPNFVAIQSNFSELNKVLDANGIREVNGIVFDLGVSSRMLDAPERGFSFQREGPLDMRMDRSLPQTAADLVNRLPRLELERLLRDYGEEPFAARIARKVTERRDKAPLATTKDLAELVFQAYPGKLRHGRIHPATRTFQALRIAVNDELRMLESALSQSLERLAPGGVLCCVSYHSLEDRIVKQFLKSHTERRQYRLEEEAIPHSTVLLLTPKPLRPTPEETGHNPRARSAKLRAAEKLSR